MESELHKEVGIIYSKDIAEISYGPILEHITITTFDLSSILDASGSYVMFYLNRGMLIISDEKRKSLLPENVEVSGETVFHYFSVNKVKELLKLGNESETIIE